MFNYFQNIPLVYPIYFFYGSAFLFLGFSIFIKDMKGSNLKLADSLWLLALFGITHGINEFLQLYPLIEGDHLTLSQIFNARLLSLVVMVASYFFLLVFGLVLILNPGEKPPLWMKLIPGIIFSIWIVFVAKQGFSRSMSFLAQAELGARYTFGLSGGLMAAYSLISYSKEVRVLSQRVSRHLRYAGITFVLYAVFAGVFVTAFFRLVSFPYAIELLRAVCAMIITYFIIRALNIFNIDTRRRIEQQMKHLAQTEKLSSLGQLAAGIAHEINNPLTNASLGIETIRQKLISNSGDPEMINKLNAVERNIDRASSIARELLQLSRQKECEFVPVDINSVIQATLTLMKHRLEDFKLKQNLMHVAEIMGDPGKMEQVIINVLSNSIEAMPEGGAITISSLRSNDYVKVQIADSGIGIPEKKISRVFDPFFTTKELGRGTGLGLTICYGIIQQHHGSIQIESTAGKGTTVTIKIPTREHYEKYTYR